MSLTKDIFRRGSETFTRKGPGGRSSATGHIATVFGCGGFLGRYLVNALGRHGTQVVTPYHGTDDDRRHLRIMGDLGQIVPLRFDLRNHDQLVSCIASSDTVYNLIGKSFPTKNFSFESVHVDGARKLAKLSKELGVSKFVHVSALGAHLDSKSQFLKSKALGEIAVREEFPEATIVRPATMYGQEDRFWNMMGFYSRFSPIGFPIVNGGQTFLRPVYVNDVALALASILRSDIAVGRTVELYGPRAYKYEELVRFFLDIIMRDPTVWHAPKPVAKALAAIVNMITFHTPLIHPDEVERLYIDQEPQDSSSLRFEDLGMAPLVVEETILRFAKKFRPADFQLAPYEPSLRKYLKN